MAAEKAQCRRHGRFIAPGFNPVEKKIKGHCLLPTAECGKKQLVQENEKELRVAIVDNFPIGVDGWPSADRRLELAVGEISLD